MVTDLKFGCYYDVVNTDDFEMIEPTNLPKFVVLFFGIFVEFGLFRLGFLVGQI